MWLNNRRCHCYVKILYCTSNIGLRRIKLTRVENWRNCILHYIYYKGNKCSFNVYFGSNLLKLNISLNNRTRNVIESSFQHEFSDYNFKHNIFHDFFCISCFPIMLILKKDFNISDSFEINYSCIWFYFNRTGRINMKHEQQWKVCLCSNVKWWMTLLPIEDKKKAYFCGRWDTMSTCERPHVEKLQILIFDTE